MNGEDKTEGGERAARRGEGVDGKDGRGVEAETWSGVLSGNECVLTSSGTGSTYFRDWAPRGVLSGETELKEVSDRYTTKWVV